MLCPEVWHFNEPRSEFKLRSISSEHNLLSDTNINTFYFNHLVSVTVPDSLRIPEALTEKLTLDCDYYMIYDLNPSDLLNTSFLKFFVKSGDLMLLSINTRIDCDNCIGIIPTGQLVLSVNKATFQRLGIEGGISKTTKKGKDKY
ncbi:hypothetical protein NQ315_014436, partial [Exocentrus adspersus]